MPHGGGTTVPGIALPFSAGCASTPRRGAPLYGEHTKAVLKELLGCSPQQIEELSAANCIRV
jgi:crotonobetainyl-CoA:carnitine CoA-transferase CaiB-like acyl-CoA transferase